MDAYTSFMFMCTFLQIILLSVKQFLRAGAYDTFGAILNIRMPNSTFRSRNTMFSFDNELQHLCVLYPLIR
jgi:hypothetical protein